MERQEMQRPPRADATRSQVVPLEPGELRTFARDAFRVLGIFTIRGRSLVRRWWETQGRR